MAVVLQILGGLICVAGLLMTGFGLPLRYSSLDNTLIAGGVAAFVGGLILIGLGAALRELRRLAKAIERNGTPLGAEAQGKPGRSPRVRGPIPVPAARPVNPEPQLDDFAAEPAMAERAPEAEPAPALATERQRPSIFAVVRGAKTEHFEIDETESVPLSPATLPRAPSAMPVSAPERVAALAEPLFEPKPPADSRLEARNMSPAALASRAAARLDMPRNAAEPPRTAPERPSRNLFDTVWPTEPKREPSFGRGAPSERAMFEPSADELHDDGRREEAFDLAHAAVKEAVESLVLPEPRLDVPPPRFGADRHEPKFEPKFDLKPEAKVEPRLEPKLDLRPDPKPVTILKSGVIDGMAYTLYTDGSIEAQLPSGLMRFASIDDLRTYLERHT
jgi:hypothetical protein